jgi:tetratricopeptide (TPR) repeat protein
MRGKELFRVRPRAIAFTAVGVILTWLVLSQSFSAYLAAGAPQAALWLDPRQPEALVNFADQSLNAADLVQADVGTDDNASDLSNKAPGDKQQAAESSAGSLLDRAFLSFESLGKDQSISRPIAPLNAPAIRDGATTALLNDPLDARALRILGQLAEADGDDAKTAKFMDAANRLSLHEIAAAFWLLRNSAATGDFKSAVYYADIMLRVAPQSSVYVVPVLAKISENPAGAVLVKALLAENPPWREQFIAVLPNSVTDVRTPLNLLLALRSDREPLTTEDIQPYLEFLIARKFYSLAYYTWLQFLSPEELRHAGLLYNGAFESAPSGLPFDWTIKQGTGVTIDVVPKPGQTSGHALMVDFQFGRVDYHSVTELVMLGPGTYQFAGRYKGDLVGPRGLRWRIACVNQTAGNVGESSMIAGSTKTWNNVMFTFTVPEKGCDAQYVRLDLDARMASEEMVSGSIFFDDLQISRVVKPATAGG